MHFSQSIEPALYERARVVVVQELSTAPAVALTTDGWTSRATERYLTVTAHYITPEWEMKSPSLQTRLIYEQQRGMHMAKEVKQGLLEWKLGLQLEFIFIVKC